MATEVNLSAPIIKPKSGKEFLESTSFQIGQDNVLTKNKMGSIFKCDYPPHEQYGRTEGAEPPPLSQVMHKDERFFTDRGSETTNAFQHRHVDKPDIMGASGKLRETNFKMDRDTNKFNSFTTMNTAYFTPKMGDTYKRPHVPAVNTSYIPQGDKEKELQPLTDYRDRFQGHDATLHKVIRAPSMHEGGPTPIKGDVRQGHFSTTNNDTFRGRFQRPVDILPVPDSHNVPEGDPDKVVERETTMNASYRDVSDKIHTTRYNIDEVSRVLNQTNFKQHDGHFKWNDYNSTATASYRPSTIPVERYHPGKHRNHSDFPEGDLDAARVNERVNLTTSRYYYGSPPRNLNKAIISGADMRTRSNVWFGEPPLGAAFYNTTHSRNFPAKTVPFSYTRGSFCQESDVPLQYYSKSERNNTTAFTDYQNPRQGKTIPDRAVLENLQMSHIFPPISDLQHFRTTHNDTFTPKSSHKFHYDAGRLQKSSVPLGTMATTASHT